MIKIIIISTVLFLTLTGCNTVSLYQTTQTKTIQQVTLGSIGLDKDYILQKGYNNTAIPNYREPIKLSVSIMSFNKHIYKLYTDAKKVQSSNAVINYVDSVANKPKYVKLQIGDKVAVINALNADENKDIHDYLSHKMDANILNSVAIALNQNDLEDIATADAVFLIEKGLKNYVLQLYKNGTKSKEVYFNQGIIFAYETASCCWQENNRHQLSIVDIVDKFNSCPKSTFRSAKQAEKKLTYYKL